MKNLLLSLVTLLFVNHSNAQDLSIATFNCEFLNTSKVHVRYGLKFDMKYESETNQEKWSTPGFRQEKFEKACEQVAKHIKEIDADVIGLTEIGNEQDLKIFSQKLKDIGVDYAYSEICNSLDTITGQHVAVLSRFPLTLEEDQIGGRAMYFTEADRDACKSAIIKKGMHVKVQVEEKKIDIFLVHFKSERGGFEEDEQRLAQVEILRRKLIPLLNEENRLVVVMGDLNSEKRHESILKLRGFDDIHPELIQTGDDNYFENFDVRWTYNYKGQMEQIDHILLSDSFMDLCRENDYRNNTWGIKTSILETNDEYLSDHNAIKVELFFED